MNIRIYQINFERDSKSAAFMGLDQMRHFFGNDEINAEIYDKVFEGKVDCNSLEDVYAMFNGEKPEGYTGRSMSVSDVVEVVDSPELSSIGSQSTEEGFYFCDSIGFKTIEFEPEKTGNKVHENTIKVVLVEPGKLARPAEIDSSLAGLQETVGGYIEAIYPFEEEVCIICNEEGKIMGMPLNRGLFSEYGNGKELQDIIAGTFFICDCSGENFSSLNEDQLKRYTEKFLKPERFYRMGNDIVAHTYEPKSSHLEER